MIGRIAAAFAARRDGRRFRALLADRGVDMPRSVETIRTQRGMTLFHPYAPSGVADVPIDDAGEAVVAHARRLADIVAHGERWRREMTRRGLGVGQGGDGARVAHPLAIRLVIDEAPRALGPNSWLIDTPRWRRVRDVRWRPTAWGALLMEAMLVDGADGRASAWSFLDGDGMPARAQYAAPIVMPETMAAACAGRKLTEIVDIASTGWTDVDQAIAGLTIGHAETAPRSTVLTLEPTPWLGWTGDPDWTAWHRDNPFVA